MVRFLILLGAFALVGLAAAGSVAAEEPKQSFDEVGPSTIKRPAPCLSIEAGTAGARITACDLCSGPTCTTVRVRGKCTVDKAVAALRRSRASFRKGASERLRHKDRAVTTHDYEQLTREQLPGVGRARAEPRRTPQARGDAASRLLELYRKNRSTLSVRESNSGSLRTRSLRPPDLSGKKPEEDEDGKDDGQP